MMAPHCATLPSTRKISFSIHGTSSKNPWMILSNTFGTDISLSEPVARRFAASGFRVLSYDHPGHGQSSPIANVNKVDFEEMIDDIDDLLYLLKIESIHTWIGISLGAASGVYMACRRPKLIKHLIYCGFPPASLSALGMMSPDKTDTLHDEAENDGRMANIIRNIHCSWASRKWLEENPDQDARLKLASSTLSLDGLRAMMTLQKNVNFDMRPLVPELLKSCDRIMFVKGETDVRTRRLVDMMIEIVMKEEGDFKVVIVPGSGHVMFLQNEGYFCDSILDFIS